MTARDNIAKLEKVFSPPSMLAMPYSSLSSRRAAQEDAYMEWCEARIIDQRDEATRQAHMAQAMDAVAFFSGDDS